MHGFLRPGTQRDEYIGKIRLPGELQREREGGENGSMYVVLTDCNNACVSFSPPPSTHIGR